MCRSAFSIATASDWTGRRRWASGGSRWRRRSRTSPRHRSRLSEWRKYFDGVPNKQSIVFALASVRFPQIRSGINLRSHETATGGAIPPPLCALRQEDAQVHGLFSPARPGIARRALPSPLCQHLLLPRRRHTDGYRARRKGEIYGRVTDCVGGERSKRAFIVNKQRKSFMDRIPSAIDGKTFGSWMSLRVASMMMNE